MVLEAKPRAVAIQHPNHGPSSLSTTIAIAKSLPDGLVEHYLKPVVMLALAAVLNSRSDLKSSSILGTCEGLVRAM
jgi:hypothetical protein